MLAVSCAHRQRATTPPHAQRQQQWCRCQRNSMKPVCSMWQQQWQLLLLLLLLLAPGCSSSSEAAALSDGPQAITPCPGKPHCVQLVVDGTIVSVPPLFRQSVTNASVNEIVLPGTRYVLRPSSWTVFSQQQPYRLTRNLTIRGQGQVRSALCSVVAEEPQACGVRCGGCHHESKSRDVGARCCVLFSCWVG